MDTLTLINRAHAGDKTSRDRILMENTGLIWSIVKRFLNRGYEGEDLFQIGCIGMLKAIDRFDVSMEVAFSTYAFAMITGEIRRFLRDDGIIKISRKIKENQLKIITETEKFRQEKHREPTIDEIATWCKIPKEDVVTAVEASREVESIYQPAGDFEQSPTLLDKIVDVENIENVILNRLLVNELLEKLSIEERKIIILRYFKNKTQTETACLVGTSQVQISRMEKKILNKLKKQMDV